jgi:putative colanic acid biosynthesis acetyltransferase WcaB
MQGDPNVRERGKPGFIETVRRDLAANRFNSKGKLILLAFRFSGIFARSKNTNRLLWFAGFPILILYRVIIEWLLCVELPAKTEIGPGLIIFHGQALVVNDHTRIGSNCILRHSTTIGCKTLANGEQGPSPVLGDRVDVGSNVVILGDITIGDDVAIGAGSVVVRDVPDGAVVVGNPARIVSSRYQSAITPS